MNPERDPIEQAETDLADDAHRADVMGFNDGPESLDLETMGDDDGNPFETGDEADGDFVDHPEGNPKVVSLPSSR